MADVSSEIRRADVFALNAAPATPAANLFVTDPRLVLRSDCDSQLLLHIPFNQGLKLATITLDCGEAADAPTRMRLYANFPSLGFSDLEGTKPTQELVLSEADVRGRELKLALVRFTRVNSLHVFLEREDAETVSLSSIRFGGTPVEATKDLKDLGKTEEGHGHSHG